MTNSTEAAMSSYALTPFLLTLIQHFPQVTAVAVHRAQSDEARDRIEAFLAKVQRISATGGFFWHAATSAITASEQVYHIFDLDPALPLTLDLIVSRVHPDDVPLFRERIEHARSSPGDVDFEPRLRLPDGSIKYLHVMAHGVRNQAGQLEYIGAVHDVTGRQLSEDALSRANAALTQMTSLTALGILAPSIAHEVTQPLTGIMTNANTCLRALATDPPSMDGARAAARRTLKDVERAHDLIAHLRMLAGKKEIAAESLDLNDAIQKVVALFSSELQQHRVVLRTEFARDLPRVKGDRTQLQQVVLNLLAGTLEAIRDVEDHPRDLLIRTERQDGQQVCITVRDARAGPDPMDDSMGIRLFVSRTIVERHRGRLWAQRNPGHGTTFSFCIPHELPPI